MMKSHRFRIVVVACGIAVLCAAVCAWIWRNEVRLSYQTHRARSTKGTGDHLAAIESVLQTREAMNQLGEISEDNLERLLGLKTTEGSDKDESVLRDLLPFVAAPKPSKRLAFYFPETERHLFLDFDTKTGKLDSWCIFPPLGLEMPPPGKIVY
jgi:hypothetical protein